MKLSEVLAISGLTKEQKEAAERWFNTPFNKEKELNGTKEEIKKFLAKSAKDYAHRLELKEKNGTLDKVTALVKELCKGTRKEKALYTYNDIIDIINEATEEKKKQIEEIRDLERQLAAKKAELGLK